jgi:hypothetical protein
MDCHRCGLRASLSRRALYKAARLLAGAKFRMAFEIRRRRGRGGALRPPCDRLQGTPFRGTRPEGGEIRFPALK